MEDTLFKILYFFTIVLIKMYNFKNNLSLTNSYFVNIILLSLMKKIYIWTLITVIEMWYESILRVECLHILLIIIIITPWAIDAIGYDFEM